MDSSFLEVFIWKGLINFSEHMEFPALVIEVVTLMDDSKTTKISGPYKPRTWRWLNMKPLANKSLVKLFG